MFCRALRLPTNTGKWEWPGGPGGGAAANGHPAVPPGPGATQSTAADAGGKSRAGEQIAGRHDQLRLVQFLVGFALGVLLLLLPCRN